jgi:hypothetical protein
MKVKISREARILMGLMFAAAAVLVWINFFTQRQGFDLFGARTAPSSSTVAPSSGYVATIPSDAVTPDASVIDPATLTSPTADTGVTAIDSTASTPEVTTVDPTAITDAATDPTAISTDATLIDPTTFADPAVTDTAVDPAVVAAEPVDATVVDTTASADAAVTAVSPDSIEASDVVSADAASEATITPEVAADIAPSVAAPTAARDIELAELPFLVTELAVVTDVIEAENLTSDEVLRPGEQRASINPFAPIVLKPVEVAAVPLPQGENIIDVPIPDAPTGLNTVEAPSGVETVTIPESSNMIEVNSLEPGAPTETVVFETPLPEAVTPAPAVASLPRPLPGGTLPVAPEILRTMSVVPPAVDNNEGDETVANLQPQVAEVEVAIRLPNQAPVATAIIEDTTPSIIPVSQESELEPITALASDLETAPNGGPIAAGLSGLSRYLRDNDVRFTGSVIGPVGVGIFRSSLSKAPYVITLGQTIPNTDIVLTSLQGKQAQFTQGQEVQSLTLDLRR